MKLRRIAWVMLLLNTACGTKNPFAGRERRQAPVSPQDVGVLVEDSTEVEIQKILADFPEAQVRVLSQAHGLFEVFGVNQGEVAARVGGRAQQNQYFQFTATPAPLSLNFPGLSRCRGGNPRLTTALSVSEPVAGLKDATIPVGTKIRVSAKSTAALSSAILLSTPAGSAESRQVVRQSDFEFTPAALGVYEIYALAQDLTGACALDGVRFIVTANDPFDPAKAADFALKLNQFTHLDLVQAREAWEISDGRGITIAVIDSGVNYNHPALASQMAVNAGEIPGNGVDDDGDGLVDDVVGYDFVNGDAFPFDDYGHGSHVSGLIAARQFGMAQGAKILAVKALTGLGGDIGTIAAALRYAVDQNAKIVNMSLGAPAALPHPALVAAMAYAESKGVLVVTAAGNGDPQTGLGYSIDEIPFFPAALPNDNLLTVAAFDSINKLSLYSNFGAKNVDVIAPGGDMPTEPVYSCALANPQGNLLVGMSGTSMAAPVVAGLAAEVLSLQPHLSVAELKALLINSGELDPDLTSVSVSGRHINAFKAIEAANARNVLF